MSNQLSAYTGLAPHTTYFTSPVLNEYYEESLFHGLFTDAELYDAFASEMLTEESTVAQDTFANSLPLNNDDRLPQQEIVFSADAYYLAQDIQVSSGESSNSSPSSSPSITARQFRSSTHDSSYEYPSPSPSPSPSPTFRRREVSGGTPMGKRSDTRAMKAKTCQYPHCGCNHSREQDVRRHIKNNSKGRNENCLPIPSTSPPPLPSSPSLPPLRRHKVRGGTPLGRVSDTRADRCQCPFCNRTYSRQQDVKRHIKSHSEDRNERCSYCPKDFKRHDSLIRHERKCMVKSITRS